MKNIKKVIYNTIISAIFLFTAVCCSGCGSALMLPYQDAAANGIFTLNKGDSQRLSPFAGNICIAEENSGSIEEIDEGEDSYRCAGLFNINNLNTIYTKNIYDRVYPASLTKLLTAYVAMKYGKKEDLIVCSANVNITEPGAQVCGFKEGDTLTLDQAMHGLLMYSGNDAAIAIAEKIGGSVEGFCELMNSEARSLGATGTHFVNPHGLHNTDHYTTPYDLYLIFNADLENEWFREIINKDTYSTTYMLASGANKDIILNTTNLYIKGDKSAPEGITVLGGKTGTTNAAGFNLILLSKNAGEKEYISIVMNAKNRDTLYNKMTSLLSAE